MNDLMGTYIMGKIIILYTVTHGEKNHYTLHCYSWEYTSFLKNAERHITKCMDADMTDKGIGQGSSTRPLFVRVVSLMASVLF